MGRVSVKQSKAAISLKQRGSHAPVTSEKGRNAAGMQGFDGVALTADVAVYLSTKVRLWWTFLETLSPEKVASGVERRKSESYAAALKEIAARVRNAVASPTFPQAGRRKKEGGEGDVQRTSHCHPFVVAI
jgi:hypothetical protein